MAVLTSKTKLRLAELCVVSSEEWRAQPRLSVLGVTLTGDGSAGGRERMAWGAHNA